MMPAVGRESAPISSMELQRLKAKRMKRGECPDCGTMLYKTGRLGRIQKKKAIPINEEGKCLDGRCLVCEPLPDQERLETLAMDTKAAVPRIVWTYLIGGDDPGSRDLQLLGLDMGDELSDVTLDRRLRTETDDAASEKSKLPPGRSKKRIGPELNMNEPLRIRMELLLRGDATEPVHRMSHRLPPEEEMDGPEPSLRSPETPEALLLKKVFRPDNVFVSPDASYIHRADEAYPHTIILERPEDAVTHADNDPPNGAEIVFDLAAPSPPLGDTLQKEKMTDEDSVAPLPPQHPDSATVDSSHHDTAEYSAYSSKLLELMLDESDFSNPPSSTGGGRASLRVPRIHATASAGEAPTHDSSYHGMETGDVYVETGIPKVVYSSSSHAEPKDHPSVDGHSKASSAQEEASSIKALSTADHHSRVSSSQKKKPPPEELRKPPPPGGKWDPESNGSSETVKKSLFLLEHGPLPDRESVLLQLAEILWNNESCLREEMSPARQLFVQQNGAKILATVMWATMSEPPLIRAALRLFFALIAYPMVGMDPGWNDDDLG
jgi:hypothetical protein